MKTNTTIPNNLMGVAVGLDLVRKWDSGDTLTNEELQTLLTFLQEEIDQAVQSRKRTTSFHSPDQAHFLDKMSYFHTTMMLTGLYSRFDGVQRVIIMRGEVI